MKDIELGCRTGFLAQTARRKPVEQKQAVAFSCGVEPGALASSVRYFKGHGCLQHNGAGALPGTKHKINSNGSEAKIPGVGSG